MYSKSKSKSNTKNKGESKKSKKDPQMHQSGQNIKNKGESKKQYATRILNEKYGKGNWGKGSGSEYSRIIKYHRK